MPAPAAAAGAGTSADADADGGDAAASVATTHIRLNSTIKNVLVALLQNSSSEVVAGLPSMRAEHGKTNQGHVIEAVHAQLVWIGQLMAPEFGDVQTQLTRSI